MLQIISGKFFTSSDRHHHQAKGILYSNYTWIAPIETCIGVLEPVDAYSASVNAYVFSYVNQIEKQDGAGGLVRTGDWEIVEQFRLLATFGLQAHFGLDRREVEINCRARPLRSGDMFLPSQFVPRIFGPSVNGSMEEVDRFRQFVQKAIDLPRKTYQAVVACLTNLDHALQVLNHNVDLAYSMLVYCIESLCQTFGAQKPATWESYDQKVRARLDEHLNTLESDKANSIREILLQESHVKLQAKFLDFATGHLPPDFFESAAEAVQRPIRRSELRQSLKNAYQLRSQYVHQLQQILHQLRVAGIARHEVFLWENEPYLSFGGLFRLVCSVVREFIDSQPSVKTEAVNWRDELPGIIRLNAAPQYWIWQHENLFAAMPKKDREEAIRGRFNGFLELFQECVVNRSPLTNLKPLFEKYELMMPTAPTVDRLRMLVPYAIYASVIAPQGRPANHDAVVGRYRAELENCVIETMIMWLIMQEMLPWTYEIARPVYDAYSRLRFSAKAIRIPLLLETKLACELANMALRLGKNDEYAALAESAVGELAGNADAQALVRGAKEQSTEIGHRKIFTLFAEKAEQSSPGEPAESIAEDRPEAPSEGVASPPSIVEETPIVDSGISARKATNL